MATYRWNPTKWKNPKAGSNDKTKLYLKKIEKTFTFVKQKGKKPPFGKQTSRSMGKIKNDQEYKKMEQ